MIFLSQPLIAVWKLFAFCFLLPLSYRSLGYWTKLLRVYQGKLPILAGSKARGRGSRPRVESSALECFDGWSGNQILEILVYYGVPRGNWLFRCPNDHPRPCRNFAIVDTWAEPSKTLHLFVQPRMSNIWATGTGKRQSVKESRNWIYSVWNEYEVRNRALVRSISHWHLPHTVRIGWTEYGRFNSINWSPMSFRD